MRNPAPRPLPLLAVYKMILFRRCASYIFGMGTLLTDLHPIPGLATDKAAGHNMRSAAHRKVRGAALAELAWAAAGGAGSCPQHSSMPSLQPSSSSCPRPPNQYRDRLLRLLTVGLGIRLLRIPSIRVADSVEEGLLADCDSAFAFQARGRLPCIRSAPSCSSCSCLPASLSMLEQPPLQCPMLLPLLRELRVPPWALSQCGLG